MLESYKCYNKDLYLYKSDGSPDYEALENEVEKARDELISQGCWDEEYIEEAVLEYRTDLMFDQASKRRRKENLVNEEAHKWDAFKAGMKAGFWMWLFRKRW